MSIQAQFNKEALDSVSELSAKYPDYHGAILAFFNNAPVAFDCLNRAERKTFKNDLRIKLESLTAYNRRIER